VKHRDNVIKILSDLVAIDSQSHKGNIKIIDFLSLLFNDYDKTEQNWVRESDGVKGKNLIVKIPGKSSKHSLVFICHMDTVPTSSAWETDPFILEEQEGNLVGLGASDTKGGVASLIEAVFTLQSQPAYDTYLVFDGDEEVTWTGLQKYKKSLKIENPHFIAIEPTDKNLCVSSRGALEFTVQTHGVSQHANSATPEVNEKLSAIFKMYKVMDILIKDADKLAYEHDPILGSNTQNLGVISGGSASNVIPDFCTLRVDSRLLSKYDTLKERVRLKKLIKGIDKACETINIFAQNGFNTSQIDPFVNLTLSVLKEYYPKAINTYFQAMSEGAILKDKGDILVLGPGSIKQAHVANEYVGSKDLFSFVHIFQKIMLECHF